MESNIEIIESFELEQLEGFNNNELVIKLKEICLRLGLELKTKVDFLENSSLQERNKRQLLHSGYLTFEVLCDGNVIQINDDDYGYLSWSDVISELELNGKYKLFRWDTDDELISEVKKAISFLQHFNLKYDLMTYVNIKK